MLVSQKDYIEAVERVVEKAKSGYSLDELVDSHEYVTHTQKSICVLYHSQFYDEYKHVTEQQCSVEEMAAYAMKRDVLEHILAE